MRVGSNFRSRDGGLDEGDTEGPGGLGELCGHQLGPGAQAECRQQQGAVGLGPGAGLARHEQVQGQGREPCGHEADAVDADPRSQGSQGPLVWA